MQRGVIVGVRQVLISADGTIGAAAGGAAGGVAGAQVSGDPVVTAFGAVGGAVVGGIGGTVAEQAIADTKGWEYIVQETGEKLVSVTQTSKTALPVGLHVLVIAGKQARIVPDYTVEIAAASPTAKVQKSAAEGKKPAVTKATKTAAASNGSTTTPIQVSPLLPAAGAAGPGSLRRVVPPSRPRRIRLLPIPLRCLRPHLPRLARPQHPKPEATRVRLQERLLPDPRSRLSRSRQECRFPFRRQVPPLPPRPEGHRR